MRQLFLRLWVVCLLLFFPTLPAAAKTILYVPADDRPVSLAYAIDTVKGAQLDILTPPVSLLSGLNREGNPDELWDWVWANASSADALVLSADSLLYGGLVDSRNHDFGPATLEWRVKRFNRIKERFPELPVYVFSTVMRSPQASAPPLEPVYYARYGKMIFDFTALSDKAETHTLSAVEQQRLKELQTAIPSYVLTDWLSRREKNFLMNKQLIHYAGNHTIQYLLVGRDDTSPFSQSNKEMRYLKQCAANLTKNQFSSFPGADQLGMLLLARAYNELHHYQPSVAVYYALGPEAATVPRYEDQPFGKTITDHILAAGGLVHNRPGKPDLVLAVNTPLVPITEEAESVDNYPFVTEATRQFVAAIAAHITLGTPVAVADVAFANGSDNSLMAELASQQLLYKLSSYSGWNTASNTLGYAIAQGMLAKTTAEKDRKRLLTVRYLDDWAWQANVRPEVFRALPDEANNLRYLSHPSQEVEKLTQEKLRLFGEAYLELKPMAIHVDFPWNRLFEIEVSIKQE